MVKEKKSINQVFRVDATMYQAIQTVAGNQKIKPSKYIRQIIKDNLDSIGTLKTS